MENSQPATISSHFVEHSIAANVFFLSSTYIPHEQSMFDQTNPRTTRIHLIGPELISRIFSSKIQQVPIIFVFSISFFEMCETKIDQFHNFFGLIVGEFLQFGPTVLCELLQTLPRPTKDILMT